MAILVDSMRQLVANAYGTNATHGALHTAAPSGQTAGAEVSGGTPAYARKALTWSSGTTGTVTASATFDVPASTTVTHTGIWSALTAGTFRDSAAITSQTFASQGTLTVNYTYTQS